MNVLFPVLIIAIGIAVLVVGKRLAVMGAAVGALLGVGLLYLLNIKVTENLLLALLIPGLLAVIGFFVAGFAKAIVNIVLLVLGALAGAVIVFAFFDLFNISGAIVWLLAVVGGVVGLIMVRRYHDWAMIIFAGLIGGLLVTRGLSAWLPVLQGAIGTLLVLVLAGVSIFFEGGFLNKGKATPPATPPTTPPAAK